MQFSFKIHMTSVFRWAGLIEGILLVFAIHQLGVGFGFIAFLLTRLIVSFALELLWTSLERRASRL